MATVERAAKVAAIVGAAGGRIVGRTRLQKVAFLLAAAGLGDGFTFKYKHYGPYSEDLATASRFAVVTGLISETESQATWGGVYSTFVTQNSIGPQNPRTPLASEMANADAIQLELAATALYLRLEGFSEPWVEAARRKPDKAAQGRLEAAKALYDRLRQIPTPQQLPAI